MAPYLSLTKSKVDHVFLTYTGYSIGTNGVPQYQFWETDDFLPLLVHLDRSSGSMNGSLFSDFLFLALGILNEHGEGRHLTRHEEKPAMIADWDRYLEELFLPTRNLDALFRATHRVPVWAVQVWIGLPYPNPQVFVDDRLRIAAVRDWIRRFLEKWTRRPYGKRLRLQGFYWTQESLYYSGPLYEDRTVITAINDFVRHLCTGSQRLRTLWIPYQQANGWEAWSELGFDLAFLQPNYYFNPKKQIETAAADAYRNGMGVEMEFDLAVTYDEEKRARLRRYLQAGRAGGTDATGREFAPYGKRSPLAWYTGGWFFGKNGRKQAMVSLYQSGDPLYDEICQFMQGAGQEFG